MKIILASGSPRRKELLEKLLYKYNMSFDIISSNRSEEEWKNKLCSPSRLVEELSNMKAEDIFENIKQDFEEVIVIGADTKVSIETVKPLHCSAIF